MIASPTQFTTTLAAIRGKHEPMSPGRFKECVASVGLTQESAGIFFGASPRGGQYWATGERPVPYMASECLEWMVANNIVASKYMDNKCKQAIAAHLLSKCRTDRKRKLKIRAKDLRNEHKINTC